MSYWLLTNFTNNIGDSVLILNESGTLESLYLFEVFSYSRVKECSVCCDGYYDPEKLLSHSNDSSNPGQQSHGLYGQVRGDQLNLTINIHKQTKPMKKLLTKLRIFSQATTMSEI